MLSLLTYLLTYRRNRDYTKQFDWTYDLNCDLYNCYTTAKENPAIGCMKPMKQNWGIIYPEFSHLSWRPNFQQTVAQTGIPKVAMLI